NDTGSSFAFTVAPYLWERWWFQTLTFAVFMVVVIMLERYASFRRLRARLLLTRQQAALDRERTRIARDLHDDLGGQLTEILWLSRRTLQDRSVSAEANERVQKIEMKAQQGIE